MHQEAAVSHRVAIVTLGCGRNEVDSDQLAGLLQRDGARVVDDPEDADALVVNTCTFIGPATKESVDTVLEACHLKQHGRARAVLVVGCMAQRYATELADSVPELDAVVGFDGYPHLATIIGEVLEGRRSERVIGVGPPRPGGRGNVAELPVFGAWQQDELDHVPSSGPRFPLRVHDGRPWAYLKIASGCDRACTFCAIPSFRGRFRSRPLDEIVAEAEWLVARGARELVLVSENTTSWGKDLTGGRHLQPRLLHELGLIEELQRLRLMYLQPAELTPELLEAMAAEPKVAPYFDLSLQHVSGELLSRMGRSGDPGRFARLVSMIRGLDPTAVFRSSFIVGFPGETEQDVAALEAFLEEHVLDWVGLFAFSPEPGTPAAELPGQVPAEVARERLARVSELQERLADEAARRFVGGELAVTVERRLADVGGPTLGRSYREAPDTDGEIELVGPDGEPAAVEVGRTVRARVIDAIGVDLVAEVAPAVVASAKVGRRG